MLDTFFFDDCLKLSAFVVKDNAHDRLQTSIHYMFVVNEAHNRLLFLFEISRIFEIVDGFDRRNASVILNASGRSTFFKRVNSLGNIQCMENGTASTLTCTILAICFFI